MSADGNSDDEFDDFDPTKAPSFSPPSWHGRTMGQLLAPSNQARGMPVQNSDELARILALPRRPVVTAGSATAEALVEIQMAKYSRGPRECKCHEISRKVAEGKRKCIKRFKWEQAWALHEMHVSGGLVASCPVGLGKTTLDVIGALALRDCPLVLLLIPSSLRGQIVTDYQLIAEHFHVPNFAVHMPGNKMWRSEVKYWNGKVAPTAHVVPYQFISDEKRSQWIENLRPNAIIADEVDALSDIESSRTMRVLRYFDQHHATTKFCGWTGSLTDNSVSEFAHTYALALRYKSPLPIIPKDIDEWSRCLDAVNNPCPPGALTKLLGPDEGIHEVRKAFHRRLAETPGIIMIGGRQVIRTDAGEDVVNDIREKVAPPVPPRVLEALALARNNIRPDSLVSDDPDEILFDPLEQARVVRQIATGVFYRWDWRGIPIDLAKKWLAARKAWHSELRWKMLQGVAQLDSAKLCTDAARRYYGELPKVDGLPEWKAENWLPWSAVKDLCNPKTEAKWIDDWLVRDAAEWASTNTGIVWYGMVEFAEVLGRLTGKPIFGDGSEKRLENHLEKSDPGTIICSIKSHGRGRNGLQFSYDNQAVLNTFASARGYQQLLGRLRRDGQQSAVVDTCIYLHTGELRGTFEQALTRGEYVQDVTTEEQMLIEGWQGYSSILQDH